MDRRDREVSSFNLQTGGVKELVTIAQNVVLKVNVCPCYPQQDSVPFGCVGCVWCLKPVKCEV